MTLEEYTLVTKMHVEKRMKEVGQWLIDNPKSSIRKIAREFNISKSTVHRYLHQLKNIDLEMYDQVITILKRKNPHSLCYRKY